MLIRIKEEPSKFIFQGLLPHQLSDQKSHDSPHKSSTPPTSQTTYMEWVRMLETTVLTPFQQYDGVFAKQHHFDGVCGQMSLSDSQSL